jgi:hypothetical protein
MVCVSADAPERTSQITSATMAIVYLAGIMIWMPQASI